MEGVVVELPEFWNVTTENVTTDFDRDESLAQAEVATLSVMFTVTVLGNTTVLIALATRPRKKLSRMYYFILHLSIADLCTAFLSVLPQLAWDVTYRFYGGPLLCKLVKYGQTLGPYLSAYILMATALDRYQAVCHPLAYCSWTSRRSRAMVWTAWGFALLFCIPQVAVFSYQEVGPGVYDCWATFIKPWGERAYVTWYSVSVFIVPFSVLAATYCSVCREIWLHAGRSPYSQQGNCSPLISRAKMNTVKQMVAVLALYVLCSAPFISAQLWATWDEHAHNRPFFTGATFTILALLSSLNSCVNPWIYLAFNRELVRLFRQQIICRGRETSSHRGGSGGSASSTGTPADTGLYKRKSFTKHASSVVVTKTTLKDVNSCRRIGSSGSRSSGNSLRGGHASGSRRLSQLTSSLFVRNTTITAAASTTCCRTESDDSDISRSTFRHDTTGTYRGLARTGAIRKKSNTECNTVPSGGERTARFAQGQKCYAYSLTPKEEKNVSSRIRRMDGADPAQGDVTDKVMALLHGERDAGRRMEVQF